MKNLKKVIIESNQEVLKNYKPLDDEEKELFEMYKTETVDDIKFDDNLLKQAREKQKKLNKDSILTIRINSDIKNSIKDIASDVGLSYQSYINMILYQIATKKIKVNISSY